MKCPSCGLPLNYVLSGNLIDWVRHPENCLSTSKVGDPKDSWEPAARHYRDIEVPR